MPRSKHIINVHTGTGTTQPSGADLYLGEIAVQHTPSEPALWIKTGTEEASNTYEKFIGETEILNIVNNSNILGSGYTYSGLPYVNSATTIADAYSALTEEFFDSEEVIASSLNDLNRRVKEISGNTGIDIEPLSAAVISLSAGVVSNEFVTALALNDLDSRIDEISGNTGGDITPLSSATYSHVTDNNVHVTAQDKTTWSGKQDEISDLETIRSNSLSGASAYTEVSAHTNTPGLHLPEIESGDEGKVLKVVDNAWCASTNSIIYAGTADPSASLGQNGDVYLQSNPVVVYETDGTTGLLGHNQNTVEGQWQLENLDLSAYKYLRCYFAGGTASGDATTPAVIVEIPLDTAAIGPSGYIGSIMTTLPFNRNREYLVSCAVDSTKTKFQVIHQNTLWDITASDANNNGRYLYKIEGYV